MTKKEFKKLYGGQFVTVTTNKRKLYDDPKYGCSWTPAMDLYIDALCIVHSVGEDRAVLKLDNDFYHFLYQSIEVFDKAKHDNSKYIKRLLKYLKDK